MPKTVKAVPNGFAVFENGKQISKKFPSHASATASIKSKPKPKPRKSK